jgi:Ferritin-like domain/TAT (twin-arginine translocation) pathway signal sequence
MQASSKGSAGADAGGAVSSHPEEPLTSISRRSFLATGLAVGAGATLGPLGRAASAFASEGGGGELTAGDAAILRFLSAAEILETDLWQQYNELGGIQDKEVPGGGGSKAYTKALEVLDEDMPQYIHDNTEDEESHFTFINAYLESRGAKAVNLEKFRTLKGSQATGAQKEKKRLTNLMELSVDTSYWTRYRSRTGNPDLGDSFAPAVPSLLEGMFPAIPRTDGDLEPENHIQAIANTAGFHFGFIEQGGSSLYPSLAQRVSDPEVLRILLSIGPTETMHFQVWHDKAGNAPPVTDGKLSFPNLKESTSEDLTANLIMPEPTAFLNRKFPVVSIIRPTETEGVATGAVNGLIADGLFRGQSKEFLHVMKELAAAADAANSERD